MKRSIILTDKQYAYLEREAARIGINVSDLIRRIIDQHRETQPVPAPRGISGARENRK